jgi:hypothetical protein
VVYGVVSFWRGRVSKSIKGFLLPKGDNKLLYSGYADDTTLFFTDLEDLDRAVKLFDTYSDCSGMKLNTSNSTVVPLGSASNVDPPINFRFRWLKQEESECLLGVPLEPCF